MIKELLIINMFKELWSKNRKIKNRLLKLISNINLLMRLNYLFLGGIDRKRRLMFKLMMIMILILLKF